MALWGRQSFNIVLDRYEDASQLVLRVLSVGGSSLSSIINDIIWPHQPMVHALHTSHFTSTIIIYRSRMSILGDLSILHICTEKNESPDLSFFHWNIKENVLFGED
jgi:hypothetical protein